MSKKIKTEETNGEVYLTQPGITQPVSNPDIPAQVEEKEIKEISESPVQIMQAVPESDEILFLKRILYIQHTGGFGRHLDDIIYERIKELKK